MRNIPEDFSELEDSGSEFDDSYTPELESVSQNEEENNQNIELTPDTSQSELPFSYVDKYDDAAKNRGITLTAPDGTEWLQMTPGDYSARRRSQQNILNDASGPTLYAKINVFAGTPASVCMSPYR